MPDNAVETAAAKAKEDFRAKNSQVGADDVTVTTTSKVTTTASFNLPVPKAKVLAIFAAVSNASLSNVTAEVATRRLGSARQLVSHESTRWHVAVAVHSTADAKDKGAMLTNNATLKAEADKQNVAAPVTEAPKLKVEVTYVITQEASAQTVAMPSEAELQQTATQVLGPSATAAVTVSLTTVTPSPSAPDLEDSDSAISLSMPFGFLAVLLVVAALTGLP